MNRMDKAKTALTDKTFVNAICVTVDGSTFDAKNFQFADAHSQRFDDQSILVVGRDDSFLKSNKHLFFNGSKWSFEMVSTDEPKTTTKKPIKKTTKTKS